MAISKWDLFKQIEDLPNEIYPKIKDYLDKISDQEKMEVILDDESKSKFEKSLIEYDNGEYLTFDQVFEKDENDV